ncbi:MAG TPA: hypothetical protein VNB54_03750 [Alphaproteobacteria bacterium]|nr:hypothetical protein [Alphaproteobacteria bacterium]
MKRFALAMIMAGMCLPLISAHADTLELKNGSVIKGTFIGGSEAQLSFRVGSTVQHYAVADISSLKFDSEPARASTDNGFASRPQPEPNYPEPASRPAPNYAESAPPAPVHSTPAPVMSGDRVSVPTGTRLTIRTIDSIDSDRNRVGDKFAATLDQPLYVNDMLVVPKGADVYGRLEEAKEAGHLAGKAQLRLSLTGIVVNGQTYALSTGDYELSGKSRTANTAKKVGGGAAVGALIGAVVGGGKGAAIGAGVGAGAGTAVQVATQGDQVHVPSETLLEFALDQPVTIPVAQVR